MKKVEIETFRDITSSYSINELVKKEPSCINFLQYRKFKITIEEIPEPKNVLIERLRSMLNNDSGHNRKNMINQEIKRLEQLP